MSQKRKEYGSYAKGQNAKEETGNKHSGAKKGFYPVTVKGILGGKIEQKPYTTGWNYSRRHGLVTFLCVEYSKSVAVVSPTSNRTWLNVMVKVKKSMSPDFITSGMMDLSTGSVIIKDLGIVINPKAPNGGYCGRYGNK